MKTWMVRSQRLGMAVGASVAIAACGGGDRVVPRAYDIAQVPAPPDPRCDVAAAERARVPTLLAEGRLDRTARVIERADALCPKTAPETWAELASTLVELGRDAEARGLLRRIDANPDAGDAARAGAERAREALAARREGSASSPDASARAFADGARARASGRLEEARRLFLEAWSLARPNGRALAWAGMTTRELGDRVASQRLFDRAIVELEGQVVVDAPPPQGTTTWGRPRRFDTNAPTKHEREPNEPDWSLSSLTALGCNPICRDAEDQAGDRALPRSRRVVVETRELGAAAHIAQSRDGRFVAVARGRVVSVLDRLLDLRETMRLEGHTKDVSDVAFSPDGAILATSSGDKTVRLWDARTGDELHRLRGHSEDVLSVTFSADGKTVASGAEDKTVRFWSVETAEQTAQLEIGVDKQIVAVAVSPDGATVATCSLDDGVRLWRVASGKELRKHGGDCTQTLAFSPDGESLASAAANGDIVVWKVATGAVKRRLKRPTLPGHEELLPSLSFSPDGNSIAVGAEKVSLWSTTSNAAPRELPGPSGEARAVTFTPDGRTVLAGLHDGTLRAWEVAAGAPIVDARSGGSPGIPLPAQLSLSLAFSPDGSTLAAGSTDHSVRLFVGAAAETRRIDGHTAEVLTVAFSPDGQSLASGSRDRTVRIARVRDGAEVRKLEGHAGSVWSVAFSKDGQLLASGSKDKTVRVWSTATGAATLTLGGHGKSVTSVAFAPDGKTLASGSEDRIVRIWSLTPGIAPRQLLGHTRDVTDVTFSPDGTALASASLDKTARIWSVAKGAELRRHTAEGNDAEIYGVAFSPDGSRLAWSSGDERAHFATVRQFGGDVGTTDLQGPIGQIAPVAFSPNGKVLAARSDEGIVLWSAAGEPLAVAVALASGEGGVVIGPGAAPLVELLGPNAEVAGALACCRSGAVVLPFEVCRERFERRGLFAKVVVGEAIADVP